MNICLPNNFVLRNTREYINNWKESINELNNRLKNQKGIDVEFSEIKNTNHFFKNKEEDLKKVINTYIKKHSKSKKSLYSNLISDIKTKVKVFWRSL